MWLQAEPGWGLDVSLIVFQFQFIDSRTGQRVFQHYSELMISLALNKVLEILSEARRVSYYLYTMFVILFWLFIRKIYYNTPLFFRGASKTI